jgi:PhoPQ-activated pathogenicity-related protein
VANAAGVLTPTEVQPMIVDTQTSDALANYVNTPDPSYTWSLVHQSVGPGDAYRYYVLSMTSQTWRLGDVNDAVWDHWLRIVVPAGELTDTAVLLISGGSNTAGMPTNFDPFAQNASDEDVLLFATAVATHSMVIELKVVPNERVFFFAEPGTPSRTEDDIIAYTYDQYLEHIGEPGNETWPLLLPMVKSAVRAMDTIQSFSLIFAPDPIENFIVTGYSKRGWTTWLTTAFDDRIIASIPGVFDNPNQGPSMVHHYQVLGRFSEEVDPYSDMQIFERLLTPEAQLLSRIVDPYRYLRSGKFDDMPMLILNSAGDEFFMSDSSQYYFADLPGDDKYMRYIPNTGHGLDGRAVESTVAFSDAILNNRELPDFTWTVEPNGEIHVHTIDTPLQVKMWQATNPFARDFRNGYNRWITWTSSVLADLGGGSYIGSVPYPDTGATAFLIELTFASGVPGVPHVFTTDVRVNSDLPRTPFPYTADPLVATASNGITGTTFGDATLLTPVPLFALPTTSDAAVPPTPSASSVEPPSLVQPGAVDVATTDTTDWLTDEDDESFQDADEDDLEFDVDSPLDVLLN